MLFISKVARNYRGNPKYQSSTDHGKRCRPLCGVDVLSAPKLYLGDENVETRLYGTDRRPEGWFVVERHDNLDEVIVRDIAGPFATEQEAERRAASMTPGAEAGEMTPDEIGDLIAKRWEAITQEGKAA